MRKSYKYAYNRFMAYLKKTPRFSKYSEILPMDAVTPDMVNGFTNYLKEIAVGEGPRKSYFSFKKVIADAVDEELIKKNPCRGIRIIYATNVVQKEILSPREINKLASFRYEGEHREVQRAFIFCCYTGMRFCDAAALTHENIDRESMMMRFNQKLARR